MTSVKIPCSGRSRESLQPLDIASRKGPAAAPIPCSQGIPSQESISKGPIVPPPRPTGRHRADLDHIINDVRVGSGHELAHPLGLLQPSYTRKQNQILQACIDRSPHTLGGSRIAVTDVVRNGGDIFGCSPRETKLHGSKRRNAAST